MTRSQNRSMIRGVSSTVKLPVSKTGLGGSNPSAPARFWKDAGRTAAQGEEKLKYGSGDKENGKLSRIRPRKFRRADQILAGAGECFLQRRAHRDPQGYCAVVEGSAGHHGGRRRNGIHFRRVLFHRR